MRFEKIKNKFIYLDNLKQKKNAYPMPQCHQEDFLRWYHTLLYCPLSSQTKETMT
jgi:hypothetical protein